MKYFKRALISIERRLGKSFILLLLVFILGTVMSGAIAAHGAVNNTHQNLRRHLPPIVTFEVDGNSWHRYVEENDLNHNDVLMEPLTPSVTREIANLPYVMYSEYSISTMLSSWELTAYRFGMESGNDIPFYSNSEQSTFPVRGTSDTELLQIREGILRLAEGRTFTATELEFVSDTHPVLVASGFASVNDLSVGDTFDISLALNLPHPDGIWEDEWVQSDENIFAEEVFSFEIIGLLESAIEIDLEVDSEETWRQRSRVERGLQMIHMPNVSAETIHTFWLDNTIEMYDYLSGEGMSGWLDYMGGQNEEPVVSIMVLEDAADLEAFHEAALELLPEFWQVMDMSNSYSALSSSMAFLQYIAGWLLWGAIVAMLLTLSLLSVLFLRDRRHEIGVYLALGEKKSRIVSQVLLEVTMTAIVGITLAVFSGSMISDIMSRNMIRNQLANGHFGSVHSELEVLGISQEMDHADMLDAFDTSLDLESVGLFYVIGLGSVVFSTVIPTMYVISLDPKKVLMEQGT